MVSEDLEQILKKERKYASFFEWPDKQLKEQGVVQSLLESLEKAGFQPLTGLRLGPHPNQAPDCVADNESGGVTAVEVTEFVCQKAVQQAQKGGRVYRCWKSDEVLRRVQEIIREKDSVSYFGGPYTNIVLVIHSDEMTIDYETYCNLLSAHSYQAKVIDEAFFLFSYMPELGHCPYVKLDVTSQGA